MKKIISFSLFLGCIPTISLLILIVFVPIVLISSIIGSDNSQDSIDEGGIVLCDAVKDIDMTLWNEQFSKAFTLSNSGDDFIYYANKYNIDPVLMASIAMHETGWGTSNAVTNYNNPGGLMDPQSNWSVVQHFNTLSEGIESMAKTLSNLINIRGLVTISDLGSVYAPIGAENDPNGLNKNWYPRVTEYVEAFGGLTMSCSVTNQIEMIGDVAWVVPYTKNITSHYGMRNGRSHNGIDVAAPGVNGKPVVAMMDGVVIASRAQGTTFVSSSGRMGTGYGWYVAIDHQNGFETRYAHLIEQGVPVGTKVRAGEIIGRVGSTGRSTGPHLHFEIIKDGNYINPATFLSDFLGQ